MGDYTTWTGSGLRADDGWHLLCTGTSRAEDPLHRRIGHAVSDDLQGWRCDGDGLCLDLIGPFAAMYGTDFTRSLWHDRAMRDPSGDGWRMFVTARVAGVEEPNAGGAIGLVTSSDLFHWTLRPLVLVVGYGQIEVPQVFAAGER